MKQCLRLLLPVILVAGLALAVRITYNLTVAAAYVPRFDAHSYEQIALHLLQEGCFCKHPFVPTVYRAPLWPAIIACIHTLFGPQKLPIRLLLSLVGTGTCLLVFSFIRDLYRRRLGLLAGLWPMSRCLPWALYDSWLYSESITMFLLLALSSVLYRLSTRKTTKQRHSYAGLRSRHRSARSNRPHPSCPYLLRSNRLRSSLRRVAILPWY